jgi:WD40 repeat protein
MGVTASSSSHFWKCSPACLVAHTTARLVVFRIHSTWGSSGSSTPVSLAWHPVQSETVVVGRQDGVVDILSSEKRNQHRLLRLNTSPARAVAYTPDGNLLIAGNDAGMLCVWDVNRPSTAPVLVHHVLCAHKSWILQVACLADSRRFVTVGAERLIHVWSVGQLAQNQPLHTFQLDSSVWTASLLLQQISKQAPRMVTGSDTGWLQVFSLAS